MFTSGQLLPLCLLVRGSFMSPIAAVNSDMQFGRDEPEATEVRCSNGTLRAIFSFDLS